MDQKYAFIAYSVRIRFRSEGIGIKSKYVLTRVLGLPYNKR